MEFVAPTLLSWVTCTHALFYDETRIDYTMRIIKMSIAYYLLDNLYIMYKRKREYYPYVLHHFIALYIAVCAYFGYIDPHLVSLYFISFEFSTLFLNIWSFTNKVKIYPRLNYITFPLTVCTYVPTRMFIVPVTTYYVFMDSWNHCYYDLCVMYVAIMLMSIAYSNILLKITFKKLHLYIA
jgi:hypothetical protein